MDLNEALRLWGFGMAVASAGPYANNLHVVPDRQWHQHPITQFLQAGCSSWRPTVSKHWRHKLVLDVKLQYNQTQQTTSRYGEHSPAAAAADESASVSWLSRSLIRFCESNCRADIFCLRVNSSRSFSSLRSCTVAKMQWQLNDTETSVISCLYRDTGVRCSVVGPFL